MTSNRLRSLIACVESYVENGLRHDRTPAFVISDDSADAAAGGSTRAALRQLTNRLGAQIRYAGRNERRRFAHALAAESALPLEIVRFGLLGDDRCSVSTGANRNSLQLDTLNELVLSVDDDTRCRMAAPPISDEACSYFAGYDPTEFWFFPDRAKAIESVRFVEVDVLGRHESLLGRAVADVGASADARGRVSITLHGLVGDSGMGSPRYYLGLTGQSRERLVASPDAYQLAFRSREVMRAVRRPTISTGPFCMTTFFGFDNRLLLPPFFPVQRNADGIFGVILQKCVDGSHIAFLPSALLHTPPAERAFEPDAIRADAENLRLSDIVMACSFAQGVASSPSTDAERMAQLGRYLHSLGSLKLRDFEAHVRGLQQYRTMAFITALESHLQTYAAQPGFWAEDVERMIGLLSKAASAEDYMVPRDLRAGREAGEARQLSQGLVARFGELLEAWPTIVATAGRLRANGRRMTELL